MPVAWIGDVSSHQHPLGVLKDIYIREVRDLICGEVGVHWKRRLPRNVYFLCKT